MFIGQTQELPVETEIASGTAFALLVALSAASRQPRDELPGELATALEAVGDTEGEVWLNLFGVALDAGPPYDTDHLLEALSSLDPVELRRHVLGRYAWSWCTLAGVDDLESAAAGDRPAASRLLEHPRYYGGHAAASLGVLLTLDPAETKSRLVGAVEAGSRALSVRTLPASSRAAAQVASEAIGSLVPRRDRAPHHGIPLRPGARGRARRARAAPRAEAPLVLAQHRSSRLIVYRVTRARGAEERLLALGRALADPKRVEILGLVGRGVGQASELVEKTGLSRSTVHHHLAQLREAGLLALEGNARAYTYIPRPDAAVDAADLFAEVIGTEGRR